MIVPMRHKTSRGGEDAPDDPRVVTRPRREPQRVASGAAPNRATLPAQQGRANPRATMESIAAAAVVGALIGAAIVVAARLGRSPFGGGLVTWRLPRGRRLLRAFAPPGLRRRRTRRRPGLVVSAGPAIREAVPHGREDVRAADAFAFRATAQPLGSRESVVSRGAPARGLGQFLRRSPSGSLTGPGPGRVRTPAQIRVSPPKLLDVRSSGPAPADQGAGTRISVCPVCRRRRPPLARYCIACGASLEVLDRDTSFNGTSRTLG